MRVVLVHPPPSGSLLPMATLTLAAVAAENGIDVELHDLPQRGAEDAFIASLAGADVVGFSTICSYYPLVLLLADTLKRTSPGTRIVLGGPQATSTADETVQRFRSIDLVIRGEAESGWEHFLRQIRNHTAEWSQVPGAVWSEGGVVRRVDLPPLDMDLDRIPQPLFHAYKPLARRSAAAVEVGRGCPYGCTFCSTNTFFARRFRMKSPSRIINEMDRLHAIYGITRFDFIHDMFTVREDSVREICAALKQRSYLWTCSSRTDRLTEDLLETMYEAGCRGMYFGIETGSQALQRSIKKNLDVQSSTRIMRLVRDMGIEVTGSIIAGFPQETRADLEATLLLLLEMRASLADNSMLLLFAPLADTPLGREDHRYAYDGFLSNALDMPGQPTAEESRLIRSSFALFSSFYHPAETDYSRSDYIALTILIEQLDRCPSVQKFLLGRARTAFVRFLIHGEFGLDLHGRERISIVRDMISRFAAITPFGVTIMQLLAFDLAVARLLDQPAGSRLLVSLHREAMLWLAGPVIGLPLDGSGDRLEILLGRVADGVAVLGGRNIDGATIDHRHMPTWSAGHGADRGHEIHF